MVTNDVNNTEQENIYVILSGGKSSCEECTKKTLFLGFPELRGKRRGGGEGERGDLGGGKRKGQRRIG